MQAKTLKLSPKSIDRYSRQLILHEFSAKKQAKLQSAHVLYIGAGGLGCQALPIIIAGGIGRVTIVDNDIVNLSNLPRQTLYTESDIDQPKVGIAAQKLRQINLKSKITSMQKRFSINDTALIQNADIVCDGSDNAETRFLLNKLCVKYNKPLMSASVQGFSWQVLPIVSRETSGCYACVFKNVANAKSCDQSGVFAPAVAIAGGMQAAFCLQVLAGLDEQIKGYLYTGNILTGQSSRFVVQKDLSCSVCA